MTFSIVGHCSETGMSGVAITTSSISVGSRCPHVRAKVGAVTTQNITDPSIGPAVLDAMAAGASAPDAVAAVMNNRPYSEFRQVAAFENSWPLVDLRVDWTEDCPGAALRNLWAYEPQMEAYNLRAFNPTSAPSYDVAGDE